MLPCMAMGVGVPWGVCVWAMGVGVFTIQEQLCKC